MQNLNHCSQSVGLNKHKNKFLACKQIKLSSQVNHITLKQQKKCINYQTRQAR